MDSWLDKVYNTSGADSSANDDMEKAAQSLLLEKVAAANGIDLSQLSPEQIQALSAEVLGDQAAPADPQAAAAQAAAGGAPDAGQGGGEQITPELLAQAQAIIEAHQSQQGGAGQPGAGLPGAGGAGLPGAGGAPAGGQPGAGGGIPAGGDALQKEAEAKFAEADFLGRVMAHAYTNELKEISKTAGVPPQFQKKDEKAKTEKTKTEKTKTANAIEKLAELRAYEMLKAAGYEVK